MRQFVIALVFMGGLGAFWSGAQQSSAPAKNDEAGIKKAIESYSTALKSGDMKAILAHWTADADFTDDEGNVIHGHEALAKRFAESLADLKAGKSSIRIKTLRFLTPDVAAMDGFVDFTPPNGAVESNKFSAVWTKKDGRWVIASARDLPEAEGEAGTRAVKAFDWITGDWTAEDRGTTVKLNVKPELGGKFASMRFEIKGPKDTMSVLQLVGWDPIDGVVRSWTYDSRGGFAEATWTRDGSVWTSSTVGVLPSGQLGSSVNHLRIVNPNTFLWQSTQREVEGQAIPDHELKFTRVAAKP